MAQVAIHEAKKVLRRELKKRIAGMSDELKLKESVSIMNKVRTREPVSDRVTFDITKGRAFYATLSLAC